MQNVFLNITYRTMVTKYMSVHTAVSKDSNRDMSEYDSARRVAEHQFQQGHRTRQTISTKGLSMGTTYRIRKGLFEEDDVRVERIKSQEKNRNGNQRILTTEEKVKIGDEMLRICTRGFAV